MVELNQDEVLEIEGGSILIGALLGAFTIFSGYTAIREIARDQGRADAYEALGY